MIILSMQANGKNIKNWIGDLTEGDLNELLGSDHVHDPILEQAKDAIRYDDFIQVLKYFFPLIASDKRLSALDLAVFDSIQITLQGTVIDDRPIGLYSYWHENAKTYREKATIVLNLRQLWLLLECGIYFHQYAIPQVNSSKNQLSKNGCFKQPHLMLDLAQLLLLRLSTSDRLGQKLKSAVSLNSADYNVLERAMSLVSVLGSFQIPPVKIDLGKIPKKLPVTECCFSVTAQLVGKYIAEGYLPSSDGSREVFIDLSHVAEKIRQGLDFAVSMKTSLDLVADVFSRQEEFSAMKPQKFLIAGINFEVGAEAVQCDLTSVDERDQSAALALLGAIRFFSFFRHNIDTLTAKYKVPDQDKTNLKDARVFEYNVEHSVLMNGLLACYGVDDEVADLIKYFYQYFESRKIQYPMMSEVFAEFARQVLVGHKMILPAICTPLLEVINQQISTKEIMDVDEVMIEPEQDPVMPMDDESVSEKVPSPQQRAFLPTYPSEQALSPDLMVSGGSINLIELFKRAPVVSSEACEALAMKIVSNVGDERKVCLLFRKMMDEGNFNKELLYLLREEGRFFLPAVASADRIPQQLYPGAWQYCSGLVYSLTKSPVTGFKKNVNSNRLPAFGGLTDIAVQVLEVDGGRAHSSLESMSRKLVISSLRLSGDLPLQETKKDMLMSFFEWLNKHPKNLFYYLQLNANLLASDKEEERAAAIQSLLARCLEKISVENYNINHLSRFLREFCFDKYVRLLDGDKKIVYSALNERFNRLYEEASKANLSLGAMLGQNLKDRKKKEHIPSSNEHLLDRSRMLSANEVLFNPPPLLQDPRNEDGSVCGVYVNTTLNQFCRCPGVSQAITIAERLQQLMSCNEEGAAESSDQRVLPYISFDEGTGQRAVYSRIQDLISANAMREFKIFYVRQQQNLDERARVFCQENYRQKMEMKSELSADDWLYFFDRVALECYRSYFAADLCKSEELRFFSSLAAEYLVGYIDESIKNKLDAPLVVCHVERVLVATGFDNHKRVSPHFSVKASDLSRDQQIQLLQNALAKTLRFNSPAEIFSSLTGEDRNYAKLRHAKSLVEKYCQTKNLHPVLLDGYKNVLRYIDQQIAAEQGHADGPRIGGAIAAAVGEFQITLTSPVGRAIDKSLPDGHEEKYLQWLDIFITKVLPPSVSVELKFLSDLYYGSYHSSSKPENLADLIGKGYLQFVKEETYLRLEVAGETPPSKDFFYSGRWFDVRHYLASCVYVDAGQSVQISESHLPLMKYYPQLFSEECVWVVRMAGEKSVKASCVLSQLLPASLEVSARFMPPNFDTSLKQFEIIKAQAEKFQEIAPQLAEKFTAIWRLHIERCIDRLKAVLSQMGDLIDQVLKEAITSTEGWLQELTPPPYLKMLGHYDVQREFKPISTCLENGIDGCFQASLIHLLNQNDIFKKEIEGISVLYQVLSMFLPQFLIHKEKDGSIVSDNFFLMLQEMCQYYAGCVKSLPLPVFAVNFLFLGGGLGEDLEDFDIHQALFGSDPHQILESSAPLPDDGGLIPVIRHIVANYKISGLSFDISGDSFSQKITKDFKRGLGELPPLISNVEIYEYLASDPTFFEQAKQFFSLRQVVQGEDEAEWIKMFMRTAKQLKGKSKFNKVEEGGAAAASVSPESKVIPVSKAAVSLQQKKVSSSVSGKEDKGKRKAPASSLQSDFFSTKKIPQQSSRHKRQGDADLAGEAPPEKLPASRSDKSSFTPSLLGNTAPKTPKTPVRRAASTVEETQNEASAGSDAGLPGNKKDFKK